ncbi:spore germination protein [Paenibacillus sp. P96]|uniref:Spore germination protein n=1 Tax=Paenibacillus zeirhizosphaerae TaxID=2987519 RepID=A0ABT9FM16_9BACL|nr:GerAB/ArcD/ProY family transporter [Paenibacillus sp. P96]MDP4095630.1 spore germination protein [Paenibacillus sp. P96]
MPIRKAKASRLTTIQATAIFVCFVMGAEMITLSRQTVDLAHTADVWLSIILSGGITFLITCIGVKLSQRFPSASLYEFIQQIIGKPLGKGLGLLIVIYYVGMGSFELRSINEVTAFFLLEGTPIWALSSLLLWTSLYLCLEGIYGIGKVVQVVFPIIILVFILICFLGVNLFELDNLRPVLSEGFPPVLNAMKRTPMAFAGSECFLFILCQMEKPQKATKVVGIGLGIAVLFYTVSTLICIGVFSVEGVITRTWPFFDLVRSVEVDYLLLERLESLLFSIWILQVFSTFTMAYYCAALGISQILKVSYAKTLFFLLPLIYIVSHIPKNSNDTAAFAMIIGYTAFLLFAVIPPILLLVSYWRRTGA